MVLTMFLIRIPPVMIYYDLFLTFGQELDTIWLVPKYNIMTLLWALVSLPSLTRRPTLA